MGDAGLNRLFSSLETSFEAALVAEDDAVAHDLAMSLRQGRPLADVASRDGPLDVVRGSGARVPVGVVGSDFVAGSSPHWSMFPLSGIVLVPGGSRPPKSVSESLVEVLRVVARRHRTVVVESIHQGFFRGGLLAVGPDHLCIETPVGELLISLGAVASVGFEEGVDFD